MEKVISSLAIRVALSTVATLPKTDMLVIDEGFSDLDETQVETCNRMIRSLKRYFRSIIIITHIEGIKEVVDNMLEITRNECDSKVSYE
jgi:DNA repair exonuclease SbcCD ATPase subunit